MVGLKQIQVLTFVTVSIFMTGAQVPLCTPAEEQQPHTITLSKPGNGFVWFKDNSEILGCFSNVCSPYLGVTGYNASVSDYTSSLFIFNVTRENEGAYSFEKKPQNSLCDLKVYAKPTSVSCQQAVLQADNVTVVCSVTRIYPNPVCQFVWTVNSTNSHTLQEQFITVDNQTGNGKPVYYNASCSLRLPARNFSVGSHQFQARVYPNVTGNISDSAFVTNSSLTSPQSVVYPLVRLEPCPITENYTEEGKPFNCTCTETANSFILANTTLSYGSTRVNATKIVTANFTADRTKGELTCETQLPDGTKTSLTQTVKVAFGPTILSFEANNNRSEHIILDRNSSVSFSCQAEGNPFVRLCLKRNGAEFQKCNDLSQKFNLTLNYSKPIAECLDTGVYTCLAETDRNTTNKGMTVYVKCIQQLRDPDSLSKIYQERVNGTVLINIPVYGYPEPTLTLSGYKFNLSSNDYNLTYIKLEPPFGNVSLIINLTNVHYFQNYTVNINNVGGTLTYSFEILDGDLVNSNSGNVDPPDKDVGAIVGGIVAAVLVIVIIVVIIFLWKRKGGPCKGNKPPNGSALMDTAYGSDLSVNHHADSGDAEVTIDNSALYHMGEKSLKSDEVTVDNSDLYNLNWRSDEVVVDNSDLYNLNHPTPGSTVRDSKYKNYSEVVPTITTATSLPLNMRNKKTEDISSPYEDVSSGDKSKPKPRASQKPKPVAKPKPQTGKQSKSPPTDETYAMVVKVAKSDKPFAIKEETDDFFYNPSQQPEIPEKNFENPYEDTNNEKITEKKTPDRKKKNTGKPSGKASDQHNNPSSPGYTNGGFSNPEDEVNVYENT